MSAPPFLLQFTRGAHRYALMPAHGGYVGIRDGAVVATGQDRYRVAHALIVAGSPSKEDANARA